MDLVVSRGDQFGVLRNAGATAVTPLSAPRGGRPRLLSFRHRPRSSLANRALANRTQSTTVRLLVQWEHTAELTPDLVLPRSCNCARSSPPSPGVCGINELICLSSSVASWISSQRSRLYFVDGGHGCITDVQLGSYLESGDDADTSPHAVQAAAKYHWSLPCTPGCGSEIMAKCLLEEWAPRCDHFVHQCGQQMINARCGPSMPGYVRICILSGDAKAQLLDWIYRITPPRSYVNVLSGHFRKPNVDY